MAFNIDESKFLNFVEIHWHRSTLCASLLAELGLYQALQTRQSGYGMGRQVRR
jgi:hypothetical protein